MSHNFLHNVHLSLHLHRSGGSHHSISRHARTGLVVALLSLGCLAAGSSAHAQAYLVGAYLFAADSSGATISTAYQYDTNNTEVATALNVGGAGKNLATSLSSGNNIFTFSQALNQSLSSVGGTAGDVGLFFSSTSTPYNSTTPRTPDLIVGRLSDGSAAFFTPTAGTAINSYYYAGSTGNSATSIALGSNIISVTAFSVTDTPDGSFTLNVSPVATSTPEPGSVALLSGLAVSGGVFMLRRRRKA